MKIKHLFLIGLLAGTGALSAIAHDFTATVNGRRIYFNITDKARATAEVTYKGSIGTHAAGEIKGEIEIPARVKHGEVVYEITAVGPKAFSGAEGLTGIILPASVKKIGDFAFEGCTQLSKVVFPGGDVTLGQGTFFKCTALRDLSFGSDWKTLDLQPYRWSDSLRVVTIPAKVGKVQNLKSLKSLQRVEVDVNNTKFRAEEGLLYSKDGRTLYGVPRGHRGRIVIRAGAETVTRGAMADCPGITVIVFPESLKTLSFRETARLAALKEVVFKGAEPINTAYAGGKGRFLLQVANPEVKIVVPKGAKKNYAGRLTVQAGEYAESAAAGSIPYRVADHELPAVKNIQGVKKFDRYE